MHLLTRDDNAVTAYQIDQKKAIIMGRVRQSFDRPKGGPQDA
jgi:hypothetical protein